MKKPFEMWQAVLGSVAMLMAFITIIVQQSNRITRQAEQIQTLQRQSEVSDKNFDKLNMNLDKVNNRLTDILIELQNKKDRDK